jgi:putative endonuclease
MISTRDRGTRAETQVTDYLSRAGMQVVDRNFASAGGEVDIVGCHGDTYVFVEVRYRRADKLGAPVETVDGNKQRRVIKAATSWLVKRKLWDRVPVRFDVVGVTGNRIEWIKDAFRVR